MPGTRPGILRIPSVDRGSVVPALPSPGPSRIVFAGCPPTAGKKLVLIGVPSNEITLTVNATGAPVGFTPSGFDMEKSAVNGTTTEAPKNGTRNGLRPGTWFSIPAIGCTKRP